MCLCETGELIKNGGFEIYELSRDRLFEDWTPVVQNMSQAAAGGYSGVAHEGAHSALFISRTSTDLADKSASLRQPVIATPGCIYQLSFAENLTKASTSIGRLLMLVARVFYMHHEIEFDLIRVPMMKSNSSFDVNKGFTFHARTSDRPVPCDVSEVIVQFDFIAEDIGGTLWAFDSVSLRAVFPTSACC
jgi:hypothetical protein